MTSRRYIIIAPSGRPLLWTQADSERGAISLLLPHLGGLWHFAQEQGYSVAPVQ